MVLFINFGGFPQLAVTMEAKKVRASSAQIDLRCVFAASSGATYSSNP
jgi:hypothetical protein